MISIHRALLVATILLATPVLHAKNQEDAIQKQIDALRDGPQAQRPAATLKLATDIRALPASKGKVTLADNLEHMATEGDPGMETLQAVADTLAQALTETPVPAKKDWPAPPYFDLAKLVHYEHATTTLSDPNYTKAADALTKNDADIGKIDFTLKDINGKKVTLSQLRGKVVLVSFWTTWSQPSEQEMPDLDAIYTHLASKGLVILSIDPEDIPMSDLMKVATYVTQTSYHAPVLLDPGGKVQGMFHLDGAMPESFVFYREGKLVAVAINKRTQRQFLNMIALAGIEP